MDAVKMSASELELYTNEKGVGLAAYNISRALTRELRKAFDRILRGEDKLTVATDVRDAVYDVMDHYTDFGARDTEPEWHVVDKIRKVLGVSELDRW